MFLSSSILDVVELCRDLALLKDSSDESEKYSELLSSILLVFIAISVNGSLLTDFATHFLLFPDIVGPNFSVLPGEAGEIVFGIRVFSIAKCSYNQKHHELRG